jgi:hypothetical protein
MPLTRDAERLLQDAVNLQIDTVVKSAMTGRSMPSFPHALIDLGRAYARKLQDLQPAPGTAAHASGEKLSVDLAFIFNAYLENAPWPPRPETDPATAADATPESAGDPGDGAAATRFLIELIDERERLARTAMFEEVARRAAAPAQAPRDALVRPGAPPLDRDRLRTDWTTFAQLRLAATLALHAGDPEGRQLVAERDRMVLERVRAGCDVAKTLIVRLYQTTGGRPGQIARLLGGALPRPSYPYRGWLGLGRREVARRTAEQQEPPCLPADEAARLRKYWELGTETIVLQTVLSLGGDVVTRVPPGTDDGALAPAAQAELARLHQDAVAASTGMWRTMMEIVIDVLTRVAGTMRPRF